VAPLQSRPVKRQYLGDSKDSFKWDYHDHLAAELRYPQLNVALMLTPDDGGGDGKTRTDRFPARTSILNFCRDLQSTRDLERITRLAAHTGSDYRVTLHKRDSSALDRVEYFAGFDATGDQIVFVDPDNGFEPERSCSEKHVSYRDIARILDQLNPNSIVSVFHHFRRIPFPEDFARIRSRLGEAHSTAIFWHSLMFVAVARSESAIKAVIDANKKYAKSRPVRTLP
jgi:hypothetical protein